MTELDILYDIIYKYGKDTNLIGASIVLKDKNSGEITICNLNEYGDFNEYTVDE